MVVKDLSVSQKHAEVVWSGAAWTLVDVGSSNGTTLNDEELPRQGARRLRPHTPRAHTQLTLPAARQARRWR